MTSPVLKELYSLWYLDGKKRVPLKWVKDYLKTDGLALWYQDDGCLKNGSDRIILSVDAFQEEEVSFLQKEVLGRKFKIKSTIDSQGRIDISSRKEVRKFQSLVERYIHPSMERKSMVKIIEKLRLKWQQKEKTDVVRTSIYLPYYLYDQLCGDGYSEILNRILSPWLEALWKEFISNPAKMYEWILTHESFEKGKFLLTPRFKPDVKNKLDTMSILTGFEISELVVIALMEIILL